MDKLKVIASAGGLIIAVAYGAKADTTLTMFRSLKGTAMKLNQVIEIDSLPLALA